MFYGRLNHYITEDNFTLKKKKKKRKKKKEKERDDNDDSGVQQTT